MVYGLGLLVELQNHRCGDKHNRENDFWSLAHIIHDSSSRNRWAASRDRRAETWGPDSYSCSTWRVRGASPLAEGSS